MELQEIQDHFLMLIKSTCFFCNIEPEITEGEGKLAIVLRRTPSTDRKVSTAFRLIYTIMNASGGYGKLPPASRFEDQSSCDDYGDDIQGMQHYDLLTLDIPDDSGKVMLSLTVCVEDYRVIS